MRITKLSRIYTFLGLLIFIGNTVIAQSWEQLPIHGGGYVTGLIPHPTDENIVFARIDVAGVYKTVDGGDNWTAITSTIEKTNNYDYYIRSFAIDASNTQKHYSLSGNAPYENGSITNEWFLWQTTNGGTTWTKTIAPFAIGGNGQYRNAGETMVISPNNSDILYLSGQPTYDWGITDWKSNSGLYQYQISTDTWTQLDGGILAKAWTTSLKFDNSDNDILYVSATENDQFGVGSTGEGLWKYQISTGILTQVYTGEVFDFDFDANGSDTIVAMLPNGIDWTFDGGINWQGVSQPFGHDYNYFIKTHPTNSGQWFFGYWDGFNANGIIETKDWGTNFYKTKYGSGTNQSKVTYPTYAANNYQPNFGNATATLLFHPANTNHIYTSDWYGIFKSTDGSLDLISNTALANTENANWSWEWKTKGIHNVVQLRVTKHPKQSDIFYNCIADIGFYNGSVNNNTATYQTIHPITSVYKIEYSTDAANVGYMIGKHHSGKGRILKTTDNGTNWVEVNSNFIWGTSYFEANSASAVTDLQVASGSGDTLVVGIDKGAMANQIYLSTDGGATYSPWDDNIGLQIFKSWTALDKLLLDADGQTFYAWHESKLYRRNIAAAQWTEMTNPGGTSWFAQVITDPNQSNTLYATQYGNVLYKSTDGGSTWTTIATTLSRCTFVAISENGNLAIMDGNHPNSNKTQSLFTSGDNGNTWTEIGMTNHPTLVSGILFLNDFKLIGWSPNSGAAIVDLSPVLPVDLLSFEGNCKNEIPQIYWQTANEINFKNFEIQRKSTTSDWEKIATIEPKGQFGRIEDYQYTDDFQSNESLYYRLKLNDFGGYTEWSNIVTIECEKDDLISIYPNPTNGSIYINSLGIDIQSIDLQVFNAVGQLMDNQVIRQSNGLFEIDISNLPKGVYYLKSTRLNIAQSIVLE